MFPALVAVSTWSTALVLPYKHSTPGRQRRQQRNKKPFAEGRKDSSVNNALLHFAFKEFLYNTKNSMKYICVGKHEKASMSLLCFLRAGLKELGRNCSFRYVANPSPNRSTRKDGSGVGPHRFTKPSYSFNHRPKTSLKTRLDIS